MATWKEWVGFPDLDDFVEDLNTVCDDGNRHSLLELNTSKRTLLQSRLGRMRLWKGGFTVVVLRPVLAAAGWDQHCIAVMLSRPGIGPYVIPLQTLRLPFEIHYRRVIKASRVPMSPLYD